MPGRASPPRPWDVVAVRTVLDPESDLPTLEVEFDGRQLEIRGDAVVEARVGPFSDQISNRTRRHDDLGCRGAAHEPPGVASCRAPGPVGLHRPTLAGGVLHATIDVGHSVVTRGECAPTREVADLPEHVADDRAGIAEDHRVAR